MGAHRVPYLFLLLVLCGQFLTGAAALRCSPLAGCAHAPASARAAWDAGYASIGSMLRARAAAAAAQQASDHSSLGYKSPVQHQKQPSGPSRQLTSFPSVPSPWVNGSVTVSTWSAAAFQAWCLQDSTCASVAAAGNLSYSLQTDRYNASGGPWSSNVVATAVALTLSFVADKTLTNVRAASDLVLLALAPTNIKADMQVCNQTQPCNTTLTFSLSSNITLVDPFVCVRLVPSGGSYQIEGYPAGSAGLALNGSVTNAAANCVTNQLGYHAVLQYTRVRASPSPSASPATSPAPAPSSTTAQTAYAELPEGPISITFSVTFNLDFTALTTDAAKLANFTQDTTVYVAKGLATARPSLFMNAATGQPYPDRVNMKSISPGSVVAAYTAQLPDGSGQTETCASTGPHPTLNHCYIVIQPLASDDTFSKIDEVKATITSNATALLAGSWYQASVVSGMIMSVDGQGSARLPLWEILLIISGSAVAAGLLVILVAFAIRHKRAQTIVPVQEPPPAVQEPANKTKSKKRKKQVAAANKQQDNITQQELWAAITEPAAPPPTQHGFFGASKPPSRQDGVSHSATAVSPPQHQQGPAPYPGGNTAWLLMPVQMPAPATGAQPGFYNPLLASTVGKNQAAARPGSTGGPGTDPSAALHPGMTHGMAMMPPVPIMQMLSSYGIQGPVAATMPGEAR